MHKSRDEVVARHRDSNAPENSDIDGVGGRVQNNKNLQGPPYNIHDSTSQGATYLVQSLCAVSDSASVTLLQPLVPLHSRKTLVSYHAVDHAISQHSAYEKLNPYGSIKLPPTEHRCPFCDKVVSGSRSHPIHFDYHARVVLRSVAAHDSANATPFLKGAKETAQGLGDAVRCATTDTFSAVASCPACFYGGNGLAHCGADEGVARLLVGQRARATALFRPVLRMPDGYCILCCSLSGDCYSGDRSVVFGLIRVIALGTHEPETMA